MWYRKVSLAVQWCRVRVREVDERGNVCNLLRVCEIAVSASTPEDKQFTSRRSLSSFAAGHQMKRDKRDQNAFAKIWQDALRDGNVPGPQQEWLETVLDELFPLEGKRVLEGGSGSGSISLALAWAGAECTLLDLSSEAIELSQKVFADAGAKARFSLGDVRALPFHKDAFDAVYNVGVLEHFQRDHTAHALQEMCRVCRPRGKVLVIVPSARGLLYRWGKWRKERRGKWVYGYERPIWSLKKAAPAGWRCVREYQIGLVSQCHFLKPAWVRKGMKRLLKWAARADKRRTFPYHLVGGYLLVSVFERAVSDPG